MAKPIYKLVLIRGFTEAYYQLSDDERAAFWKRVEASEAKVGAKILGGPYDCRWSNDVYNMFFIMEYSDTAAMIAQTAELEQWGFFRYVTSETILGTAQEA